MRRILHVDMDAFFAAVEELRRPELRGRPVVIGGGGDPSRRGVVSTASYEARKYGIYSGMPLRTAYRLCPDAVFLAVDYRAYSEVSRNIKKVLRRFSPVMEDVGIDEAYLDITDVAEASEEIARRIKDAVYGETGLTCSIGIAPNRLLAKIASDMQKPDGLTVIAPEEALQVLSPLPVRKLLGIGPKNEKVLLGMGIKTVAQLRDRPLESLTEHFSRSYGQYLHDASRGIDESPLVTHWEPRSMSREETFQEDLSDWQGIARNLASLCRAVAEDLRKRGYRGRTVTVKVRFADFKTHTRTKTLKETVDAPETIRRAAFEAFGRLDLRGRGRAGRKKVRLLGVRVTGLEKKSS